jgi:hypothetical protein
MLFVSWTFGTSRTTTGPMDDAIDAPPARGNQTAGAGYLKDSPL